jgi:hypothetical protein
MLAQHSVCYLLALYCQKGGSTIHKLEDAIDGHTKSAFLPCKNYRAAYLCFGTLESYIAVL